MVELEEATRRLQSAVDRLDRAVLARAEQSDDRQADNRQAGDGQAGDGQAELRAALDRKVQENTRLQAVAAEAGDRIDSAIGRLKTLLGE